MQSKENSDSYAQNSESVPSGFQTSGSINDPTGRHPQEIDLPVDNDPNVTREFPGNFVPLGPRTHQGIHSTSNINTGFQVEIGPLDNTPLGDSPMDTDADGFSGGPTPESVLPGTDPEEADWPIGTPADMERRFSLDDEALERPANESDTMDPDSPKFNH